jgi:hypothetical protein
MAGGVMKPSQWIRRPAFAHLSDIYARVLPEDSDAQSTGPQSVLPSPDMPAKARAIDRSAVEGPVSAGAQGTVLCGDGSRCGYKG